MYLRFLSTTHNPDLVPLTSEWSKHDKEPMNLHVQVDLRGEMDVKLQQTFQADLPEKHVPKA